MTAEKLKQDALARCADAIEAVDAWLGQASTRQYALDALWRARRALEAAGEPVTIRNEAGPGWRGSVFRAIEVCGLGWTGYEDELRFRLAGQPRWSAPAGPNLREFLDACWRLVDMARALRAETNNYYWLEEPLSRILSARAGQAERPAICSRCGRAQEERHADPA